MKSFLWAFLMVIVMINTASCRSEPMVVTEKAIIFIPGYSGSALKKKSSRQQRHLLLDTKQQLSPSG